MGMPLSKLKSIFVDQFKPVHLDVVDESTKHANHHFAGHDGGSHFIATIVSDSFQGMSLVDRHKAVYAVVDEYISSGDIHALALKTVTPEEWERSK